MNIQIFDANNVLTMSSLEIAELTGKQHKHVIRDIRNMLNQLEIQSAQFWADYKDSKGRTYQCYHLPKDETICLIAGYNAQVRMRIIKRWQELEQGLAVPVNQSNVTPIEHAKHYIDAAGAMCDVLRLSNSSRTAVVRDVVSPWPILANAVPAYAIDAPSDSVTGSSEVTLPITEIVRGLTSAVKANVALEKAGLIIACYRNRPNGEQSKFWSVTEEGLKYGKNQTHERNQRETQPHWYVSKADEIVAIVQRNFVS